METINILWPWQLPQQLDGVVVLIDTWAATTNIASFLARGAGKVWIVDRSTIEGMREQMKNAVVIGESVDLPRNFFHASNVPPESTSIDVLDHTVLYMSINGTRVMGLVFDRGATQVVCASFTNIHSIAQWLGTNEKRNTIIVLSGEVSFPDQKNYEDLYCAQALRDILIDSSAPIDWYIKQARLFMTGHYPKKPIWRDYDAALRVDSFPVVPLCTRIREGLIEVLSVFPDA